MNKPEMVAIIAEKANISKKNALNSLETVVQCIHDALKSEKGMIRISGLGTFKCLSLKARNGVNPRTLKKMKIPAMRVPRFSAAKALKISVQSGK